MNGPQQQIKLRVLVVVLQLLFFKLLLDAFVWAVEGKYVKFAG
jgi:hypothetical protein